MLTNLLCVALGAVLAVASPPVFRFVAAQIAKAKAWAARDKGE